ncbi:hypothetical protein QTP88_014596 [Uroleucon formosanum]
MSYNCSNYLIMLRKLAMFCSKHFVYNTCNLVTLPNTLCMNNFKKVKLNPNIFKNKTRQSSNEEIRVNILKSSAEVKCLLFKWMLRSDNIMKYNYNYLYKYQYKIGNNKNNKICT